MRLNDLLKALSFCECDEDALNGIDITNVANDSRDVKTGSLFVCIKGYTVDGHDYAEEAVAKGAVAIVADRHLEINVPVITVRDTSRAMAMLANAYYGHPTKHMPLLGVTGTNGKTTVSYLLEAIFQAFGKKTGIIGTIQLKIGEDSYPVANTTPDTLFLQKTFRQMLDAEVKTAIMEVSSHGLDIGRVSGCDFDVAIFTNLSQDHLDDHGTMEEYIRAKSMLFAQMGNVFGDKKKYAVLNVDDENISLLERSTPQHVLTYGYENEAHVMARDVELRADGTSFTMVTPVGETRINSKMIGMFNVYNMLASGAAAITQNVPLKTIKNALENVSGVAGRFEPVVTSNTAFTSVVDFAHTPDSLENVLQTIE